MTDQELIAKYNPANAYNVTEADIVAMRELTNEQLDVLAKAYPNKPGQRPYLVLNDANLAANKQLRNLSTWQNLRNVRKFAARKNLSAWTFRELHQATRAVPRQALPPSRNVASNLKPGRTVDLGAAEAAAMLKKALRPSGDADSKPPPPPAPKAAANPSKDKLKSVPPKAAAKPAPKAAADKGAATDASEEFTDPS